MAAPIRSATMFMRDNLFSQVISMALRKNGDLYYKLDTGISYVLDAKEQLTLDRYQFRPRLSKLLRDKIDGVLSPLPGTANPQPEGL